MCMYKTKEHYSEKRTYATTSFIQIIFALISYVSVRLIQFTLIKIYHTLYTISNCCSILI